MRRKKTKLQKFKEKAVKIASDKNLHKNPYCEFCGEQATVSHHFVRQSRSNYLRCDERNLIPICQKCHMRLHNGYESLMAVQLTKIRGDDWFNGLQADSAKTIKDNIGYWEALIEELEV